MNSEQFLENQNKNKTKISKILSLTRIKVLATVQIQNLNTCRKSMYKMQYNYLLLMQDGTLKLNLIDT